MLIPFATIFLEISVYVKYCTMYTTTCSQCIKLLNIRSAFWNLGLWRIYDFAIILALLEKIAIAIIAKYDLPHLTYRYLAALVVTIQTLTQ